MTDREDRIRRKAHEIWQEEGQPEGREVEHWYKAQDFVAREDFEATVVVSNAAPEAEDFGISNPDPAARHDDAPAAAEAEGRVVKATRPRKPRSATAPSRLGALPAGGRSRKTGADVTGWSGQR